MIKCSTSGCRDEGRVCPNEDTSHKLNLLELMANEDDETLFRLESKLFE